MLPWEPEEPSAARLRGSRHAPITGVRVLTERRRRGVAGRDREERADFGGIPRDMGRLLQRDPGGNARCVIRPTRGISATAVGLSSGVCPARDEAEEAGGLRPTIHLTEGAVLIDGK